MALTSYLSALNNLLNNPAANLYSQTQLTSYINRARQQIAAEGQCVRVLTPASGPISSIVVTEGGSGYTGVPDVTISGPDYAPGTAGSPFGLQASAVATVSGGQVTAVTLLSAGLGYFQPTITIGSSLGTQATATAVVSGINTTVAAQEIYPFAHVNSIIATSGSGVTSVLMVNSVSINWGTFRFTPIRYGFSKYQALVRNYTAGFRTIPNVYAQYGQGVNGSIFLYPVPDQAYQMEWDCLVLPIDLATDTDPEAIPYPWTEAIPFLAAYYAFSQVQRWTDADRMWEQYERFTQRARSFSQTNSVTSWYGRA